MGHVYAKKHSYEDYLDYKNSDEFQKLSAKGQQTFIKDAEKVYSKNGAKKKFLAEKPFKEEAARLNAESRKQEEAQKAQGQSDGLSTNTLTQGKTMLSGGEGVTLAANTKKRKTLLGG